MSKKNGASTLVDSVYNELKNGIILNEFPPGASLMPSELKVKFNVSLAVVREALTKLLSTGLVTQEPNKGFSVITLSKENFKNIVESRKIIECEALKLSILNKDVEWEATVLSLLHQLKNISEFIEGEKCEPNPKWLEMHKTFHSTLLQRCNNNILLEFSNNLWIISSVYISSSIAKNTFKATPHEHSKIVSFILDNDIENAVALYSSHIQHTFDILFT